MRVVLCLVALSVGCPKPAAVPEATSRPPAVASTAQDDAPVIDELVGTWSGPLKTAMGPMPLVMHISKDGDALTTSLDSPAQGATGIATTSTTLSGSTLVVEVAIIGGRYEGVVGGGRIEGTWTQGGQDMPLTLSPGMVGAQVAERPQTPKAPFPYSIEDVRVPSTGDVTLAGTFTIPKGDGPFPAVVLLTGSGPQDRDESLANHKPFWVIADHLSRHGVAVLRFDDRGVGASTGSFAESVLADFAADAAACLAWLDARKETTMVGYLGHSEGGYAAPIAQRTQKADFVVLLAGPGVAGGEVLEEQGALIMAASGAPADAIARNRARTSTIVALLRGSETGPALRTKIHAALVADGDIPAAAAPQLVDVYVQPWFRAFVRHDPAKDLAALGVPTLAVFGGLDLQVPPAQSRAPMAKALGKHGEVIVLEGLNHLFQPAKTGNMDEYGTIETTTDPRLLNLLADWISKRVAAN